MQKRESDTMLSAKLFISMLNSNKNVIKRVFSFSCNDGSKIVDDYVAIVVTVEKLGKDELEKN